MQRLPRFLPSAVQTLLASTTHAARSAACIANTQATTFMMADNKSSTVAASGFEPIHPFAASINCRNISSSRASAHGSGSASSSGETISVTYIDKEGKEHTVQAPIGKNLLEVAHENEIDLEGACEASLACSTCHIIFENEEYFKKVPEPTEDELDMLDLAFGLTEASRLGCQVIATKELDGVRVRIPSASRNFYVDGHKPKPH